MTTDASIPERFRIDFTDVTLLGIYEVKQKLAEGGMGAIYLAEDTSLGRKVVVKVPHARFLTEAGFRERLALEVAELVRLEHPHVTRILARGEYEETPFFILQYLGGGSLEDRLHEGKRETPEEILAWLPTMARTLDFVHRRGILHRDVKPGNILFDEEGNVFLSDFGVAKALEGEGTGVTATGVGIGSPRYMAPEQAVGGEVGPASDQYGLASTVYEALTGEPPFTGERPVEILVKKAQEEPPDILERMPDLPAALGEAVTRALSKLAIHRFESCEAFAQAFAGALGASATTTSTPTVAATQVVTPAPTRRRPWLGLGGVVLAAVVLFGLYRASLPSEETRPPPAPPPAAAIGDVILLDAGAEPRQTLRYRVVEGARERLALEVGGAQRVTVENEAKTGPTQPFVLEADVTVDAVHEEGSIPFRWRITKTKGSGALGLEGIVAVGTATPTGRVRDIRVLDHEKLTPKTVQVLGSLRLGMSEFVTPLPDEPVGIGARWETTQTVTNLGMRMTQSTTYQLEEVEGYRLKIQSVSMLGAPPQPLQSGPGAPPGEHRLEGLRGQAEETIRLDLTQLVPRAFHVELAGKVDIVTVHDGKESRRTIEFHNTMEMRRR